MNVDVLRDSNSWIENRNTCFKYWGVIVVKNLVGTHACTILDLHYGELLPGTIGEDYLISRPFYVSPLFLVLIISFYLFICYLTPCAAQSKPAVSNRGTLIFNAKLSPHLNSRSLCTSMDSPLTSVSIHPARRQPHSSIDHLLQLSVTGD
jgi:hypothetical protein